MAESDSDSAESEEDKSVTSRQSEEEEAYLDSEESHTRVKIAPRRSKRHPQKIVESEEDSDEETVTTIII